MKKITKVLLMTCLLAAGVCSAIDRLAIAEPTVRAGMEKDEGLMLWGILEDEVASKAQGKFELISRAALQQMMTEIGLTTSSDLVNLNSVQKAKLGRLETVKYLLISEIGKFGTKVNCTMRILDASTGIIDPLRTVNLRCKDLDELGDQMEWAVGKLLSDKKEFDRVALLKPAIAVANAPAYLPGEFATIIESSLVASGVPLQNLTSVDKILAQNGLNSLNEAQPKDYVHIGRLLEVKKLLCPAIDSFEITAIPYDIPLSGAKGTKYTVSVSGNVKVINTADGAVQFVQPFSKEMVFRKQQPQLTQTGTTEEYGKEMIRTLLREQILPELLQKL